MLAIVNATHFITTNPHIGEKNNWGQAARPISTSKLNAFLRLHTWPINLVICKESSGAFAREISSWGGLRT